MSDRHVPSFSCCFRFAAAFVLLGASLLLFGCGQPTVKVAVPPRVNLQAWPLIGVVEFTGTAPPALARDATEKFLQDVVTAQPKARLVELGSGDRILMGLGRSEFDLTAIKAMGDRYGVAAVLIGRLDVSGVKPDIHLSPEDDAFNAGATVHGELSAKLFETATGATVWSNGAHGQWSLGGVSYRSGGLAALNYQDPTDQVQKMIRDLAWTATSDFRPRYEQRPVGP
jgi:hypothetical protein